MSDEGRRIFPMETALEVIAGKDGAEVLDFLGFAVQHEVCDCCRSTVTPMVKGWLYSLYPDFMKLETGGDKPFAVWAEEIKHSLGDNVSLMPMPEKESAGIVNVLDTMQELRDVAAAKTAEMEEMQGKLAAAEPFKGKAAELEKKIAALEEKNKSLNDEISKLKSELAAFSGKVALNENEIEQSVKDLVSRAVKDALASLPAPTAASGATVSAAEGSAAMDDFAAAATAEPASSVPDNFGFGTSGSDDDGFGF